MTNGDVTKRGFWTKADGRTRKAAAVQLLRGCLECTVTLYYHDRYGLYILFTA